MEIPVIQVPVEAKLFDKKRTRIERRITNRVFAVSPIFRQLLNEVEKRTNKKSIS